MRVLYRTAIVESPWNMLGQQEGWGGGIGELEESRWREDGEDGSKRLSEDVKSRGGGAGRRRRERLKKQEKRK